MSSTSEAAKTRKGFLWGGVMLVSGTLCTIITKVQYSLQSLGTEPCVIDGNTTLNCFFDKPWFGVLEMKFAMAACLVFLYVRKRVEHRAYLETPVFKMQKGGRKYMATPQQKKKSERSPFLGDADNSAAGPSWSTIMLLVIPSMLDLLNTVFANIGLLWISSSIYQMTRGSVILFNAFFSVRFMGKRLFAYHYTSILLVIIAVGMVSFAGLSQAAMTSAAEPSAADTEKQANQILGLSFIFAAQFLCAIQIVIEEYFLTKRQVSPMLLVGIEGLWGLVFMVVLVPLLQWTPRGTSGLSKVWHEDFSDALVKISNSWPLFWTVVAYVVTIGVFNLAASFVTKYLNSVVRSILDTMRTMGVWLLTLFVYYVIKWTGPNSPGEPWTVWSWLELAGFGVMVVGTLTYKKILRFPALWLYAAEEREANLALTKSPETCGDGVHHCPFNKPWFGVLQVKLGMTLCLVYLAVRKKLLHRAFLETPVATTMYDAFREPEFPTTRTLVATVVPAALDLVQSVLSFVGLLWIPASVYQMSGGSMLIFSAYLSVRFLKVRLFTFHYLSLGLVALALFLVSLASYAHTPASTAGSSDALNSAIGLAFVLLSRFGYSVNIAIEEHFMTKLHVSPILQAGMEGIWGLVLFVPLIPLLSWTSPGSSAFARIWHEDFTDTWTKLANSPALVLLVVLYILCVATYNVAANWVTKHMSSIVRSMVENGRTLGVWVIGLGIYYVGRVPTLGEAWTAWSWLELLGFVLLVYATLAYKEAVRYPCFSVYRDGFVPIH
ncbi:Drug/Metabolite Transporter (DMT) Superfamily [Achlya hypogyna]|uniref:Drug/Metabolite Transporter (DMT) Superfamily n=1 Tax=Achlya hypogyna TaxID=1202772 RepID=A0A1V9ZMM0_ACHHY|nr:Drug/Metabolite Transporter (DMT) Superfamily [Achlya hypogyna]